MNAQSTTVLYIISYLGTDSTELATYDQHQRERFLVRRARQAGINAQLWLLTHQDRVWQPADDPHTWFFPVEPSMRPIPRYFISSAMKEQLQTVKPDLVVFKGMGYRLSAWLVVKSRWRFPYAFIVGGGATDIAAAGAHHIFVETPAQTTRFFSGRAGTVSVLPKTIPQSGFITGLPKEYDIINVGKTVARKNQGALIPLGLRHSVRIVGDGPLLPALQEQARRQGSDVQFLGSVPHNQIAHAIARARLMVHTATNEGFPRAFSEAFACGVPVVALRSTAEGCFEDGVHGLLVDEATLAQHTTHLLSDSSRLSAMSANAYQYAVDHFSEEATLAAVEPLYRALREESLGAPRLFLLRLFWPLRYLAWVLRREAGELFKSIVRTAKP